MPLELPDPDLEWVGHGGEGAMTVTANRGRVAGVEIDRRALREGLLEVAPSFLEAANQALTAERDAYLQDSPLASLAPPDPDAYLGPAMLTYVELMSSTRKRETLFKDAAADAADLAEFMGEVLAYYFDPIARQGAPFTRDLPALRSLPRQSPPQSWGPAPSPFARDEPRTSHLDPVAPTVRDDSGVWETIAAHRIEGVRHGDC